MSKKKSIVLSIIGLGFSVFMINLFTPSQSRKVTSINILKINPGMELGEVFNILGSPYSVNALNGIHEISCTNSNPSLDILVNKNTDIKNAVRDFITHQNYCCDGNKSDIEEFNDVTLVYTKRRFLFSYPMLWVHLDTTFRVSHIYAKEYEGGVLGFDDTSVYSFGWAMDSAHTKWDYTRTKKWINKQKLYSCFK